MSGEACGVGSGLSAEWVNFTPPISRIPFRAGNACGKTAWINVLDDLGPLMRLRSRELQLWQTCRYGVIDCSDTAFECGKVLVDLPGHPAKDVINQPG